MCFIGEDLEKFGNIFFNNNSEIMKMAELITRFHSNILAKKWTVPFLTRGYSATASTASLFHDLIGSDLLVFILAVANWRWNKLSSQRNSGFLQRWVPHWSLHATFHICETHDQALSPRVNYSNLMHLVSYFRVLFLLLRTLLIFPKQLLHIQWPAYA